jgi:redox-sensitive bicupin YhaK (pirin superfamily)|tara:strand:+ start:16105 stop:16959 length:855 start_codon:yes stop_codon:yes gene_type:complete
MNPKNIRKVINIINGIPTTDGAGVELVRVIGQSALMELDPFLLLDAFRSDNPDDYIGGFPAHPHRGFETVTYLLNGRMRHKDNTGNEGIIAAGSVQWMTAGKGIIHSEMPEQENGLLEGFQLWINLPKSHKMTSPQYQEYDNDSIPTEDRNNASIKVISGKTSHGTQGPVEQPLTAPLYFDIQLEANTTLTETLPHEHNAFVYVIKGEVTLLDEKNEIVSIKRDQLAILTKGESLTLTANDQSTQFLLIAGKPLNEPIARGGPFIMNTQDEIQQAFSDYQNGQL